MRAVDAGRRKEKSNKLARVSLSNRMGEKKKKKKEKKCNCLAHIKYSFACVCAYVRGRSNAGEKRKVSLTKEQYDREQEKKKAI
jgi:hypothetical protein